jgi:ketosteroid isomerase-like protein
LTRRMSSAALLAVLLLTSACRIERTERPVSDAASVARSDILATLAQYESAIAGRDPRRAAAFFDPDGRLSLDDSRELHGRPQIAARLQELADSGIGRILLHSEVIDLTSTAAWQLGTFEHSDTTDTAAAARGRFMIRWARGPEATWRIHHLMMNTFPADTAAQPRE